MTPAPRRITDKAVKYELLVFVEGEKTEEEYLTHYRRLHRRDTNVEIDPFRGGPLQLVQRAAAAKKRNERQAKRHGRAHDEVWCVFDVDEHPKLHQAIDQAQDNGINLAISSPCLELWFLLHWHQQTAYIGRGSAQTLAKDKLKCEKRLSVEALEFLQAHFGTAKQRALLLDSKHEGDGTPLPANPSSGLWRLIDSIARAGHT